MNHVISSHKAEVEALQEIKTEDLEGLESEIILPVMPKVEKSMIETKTLLMIPQLCIPYTYKLLCRVYK